MDNEKLDQLIDSLRGTSVPYIELIKNSRGYNWKIKVLSNDVNEVMEIDRQLRTKLEELEQNDE